MGGLKRKGESCCAPGREGGAGPGKCSLMPASSMSSPLDECKGRPVSHRGLNIYRKDQLKSQIKKSELGIIKSFPIHLKISPFNLDKSQLEYFQFFLESAES